MSRLVSELRQLQQSFFGYLIGLPSAVVEHIQSTPDTSAEQRMGIYATGYRLRLKEAIETDYERLYSYLGDELFDQLMDCYIDKYHSHHPSLRYYSQHMTELLASQEPFSGNPELVEIAAIEQAFNFSFDAANCAAIQVEQLAQFPPDDWPSMQIQFHPSIRLLSCNYNSFPIWKALADEQPPPSLEQEASTWMVWRRDLVSRYRPLSDAEARALDLMMHGANFSELCEGLLEYLDEESTPQQAVTYLQAWINDKMVCQLST